MQPLPGCLEEAHELVLVVVAAPHVHRDPIGGPTEVQALPERIAQPAAAFDRERTRKSVVEPAIAARRIIGRELELEIARALIVAVTQDPDPADPTGGGAAEGREPTAVADLFLPERGPNPLPRHRDAIPEAALLRQVEQADPVR